MKKEVKKTYEAPILQIEEVETMDVIAISGILEDVDMMGLIGMGMIETDF